MLLYDIYHKREYIIKINMEQNYKFGIFDPMAKVFYYIPVSNSQELASFVQKLGLAANN